MKRMTKFMIAIVVGWITLLFFMFVALVQVARADEPKIIKNGVYIICEINTQDNAIDITEPPTQSNDFNALNALEVPPINRLSEVLDEVDETPGVYSGINLSESDFDLLRRIVALESQGEIFRGQKAVVEVIFNRILSKKWPNDLESVIYQKRQFDTVKYLKKPYAVPGEAEDDAISEVLRETVTELPDLDYVFFSTHKVNGKEFVKIGNHYFSKD